MNIYISVDKFLNDKIDSYKAEAKRVGVIAAENCGLSPYDLDRLVVANAAAEAAMQVQNIITQSVAYSRSTDKADEIAQQEALPRIIRAIQTQMNIALRNNGTHLATVSTYNEVLNAMRTDVEDNA